MDKTNLQLLFDFNDWANARVLAICRELTDEQLHVPMNCSYTNLIGTLVHIYAAEHVWRTRMQDGVSPEMLPTATDFASLSELEPAWEAHKARLHDFIDRLKAKDLDRWVEYTTTSGKPQGSTLWKGLMQIVLHSMQFRAEAGVVMAVMGHSPGDLDFLVFLRETNQR